MVDSGQYTYNAGDLSLIPELGRSPGREHGNPLQYSFLENSVDRGLCLADLQSTGLQSQTRLK